MQTSASREHLTRLSDRFPTGAQACDATGAQITPDVVGGSVCDRYGAAVAAWPTSTPPSHEQLATLHNAACARMTARRAIAAAMTAAATAGSERG